MNAQMQNASPNYLGAALPKGPSEIDHQMERLANAVSGLEESAASLAGRLSRIRRVGTMAEKGVPEPPEEVLCEHGENIRGLSKRAANVNALLAEAIDSLAI